MLPVLLSRRGAGCPGLHRQFAAASRGSPGSLDLDCMLLCKVGTGGCEASRVEAKCGRGIKLRERMEPEGFRKSRSLELPIKKKSRPVLGTAQSLGLEFESQRQCTAVTLFAAIPRQDRQRAVDSSVTCATQPRPFSTARGSRARKRQSVQGAHVQVVTAHGWNQKYQSRFVARLGCEVRDLPCFDGSHRFACLHPLPPFDV
jgi:hypothetical protein